MYIYQKNYNILGGVCSLDEKQKLKRASYHIGTFMVSKLIAAFGTQVYSFAVSFYILQLTGSATSFALNLVCNILPRTLFAPFAGYVADRYSRKAIVIIAQIATTLAITGLLIVSLTFGLSLLAIYTTTVVLSIASTFSGITFSSSITGLVDEKRIQKAMSLNQMSISIAAIGSPAVAGLLYGLVKMPVFLGIYLAASIIAVLLESTMNFTLFAKRKEVLESVPKESMWQSMKEGVAHLRLQPAIVAIIWTALFTNFMFGAFQVGYSFILIEKLKMASQHFGITEGAFAVGMLLFSIYLSARKEIKYPMLVSKRGITLSGILIGAITLPLILPMPYNLMFLFYIGIMFAFGGIMIFVNTPMQVMLQKVIDDDFKGRVFSIIETGAMALMPLSIIFFGFLFDILSAEWILICSSGMMIALVAILLRFSVLQRLHPELGMKKVVKTDVISE